MTEQIEIEEGNNSQSQSDDDSGSDLGEGDVVEKEERRIYQPIEFDLNDPKNTFVIDFVSLQPEQQKPNNAPASQVPAVPESGAVASEAASEVKKKEPNPALFSNRMTSVIQRIEQIYATAADLGYDSDSFIDDDELFDEENDAAAEEEALYQGFYINKGELETKKRSREEVEESEEPAKKKRRVESSDNTASSKKGEGDKERTKKKKKKKSTTSKKSEGEADATKSEVKVDAAKKKTKKSSSEGEANKMSAKKKGASDTAASPDKKKSKKSAATGSTEQPFKTTQRFEEYLVQLAAAARQFVERHLKEQQTAAAASPNTAAPNTAGASTAPTAASPTATAPAKDKGVRFPRRLEPKLLLVAQELQYLYPKFDFPDTVLQRIAAPFAPVFKTDSVRQRMLRLLQQHKPEQIDEQTELGQLLKIRKYLLARFNERLQFMCDKLKRTVLPGEPPPRWTWSEDFKRWVGEIIELERVIVTLRASESESKKEPGKETKPVDMNKALKKVYGELSAMWPEGWITNQRIATAVKSRGTELRTPKELIAHHTPYLTGEKKDMHDVVSVDLVPTLQATNSSTAHTPAVRSGAVPPPPMPQITQYASTQASVQGLPSGVSFNQLTGLGWSPGSSAHLPGTFPNYLYPQQTMYSNKPGEYPYYAPPPQ